MQKIKRKLQIGVMGSAADLNYAKKVEKLAEEIGRYIAEAGNITIYGAEKDYDSLSTAASRGAKKAGGLTVGITYGKGKDIYDRDGYTDVVIPTGLERGGGREFVLVNACDGLIAISGGSGTLTEIAIAYQLNIPVVVLAGSGGWSDKLANTYLDGRNRIKTVAVKSPKEAVNKIIQLCKNNS